MIDRKITISNLETNIRWIEDIPCHQFPGWGNVTMSMRDALELLKEQEDLGAELTNAVELIHKKNERINKLLKDQETYDTGESGVFRCEKCGYGIEDIFLNNEYDYPITPVYCPNCGRLVKQDG